MRKPILVLLALVCISLSVAAQEPVDFGTVPVGGSKAATYTFRNTSLFACVLQAIGFGSGFAPTSGAFTVTPPELPMDLPQGGVVSWPVGFSPSVFGEASATMQIRVQCGFFAQTYNVPLSGQGILSLSDTIFTPFLPPATIEPPAETLEGCPCTTEIAAVDADVGAINLYLLTQLGPSVQALTAAVAELEDCCGGAPAEGEPLPGPFPSEGGAKFQRFVAAHRKLTLQSALDLPAIQPEQQGLRAILEDGVDVVASMIPELDQIASITAGLSSSDQARLDTYVPQASIDFLEATYTVVSDPSMHPKLRGLLGSTGQGVAGTIWDKVRIWIEHVPVVGGILGSLMDDVGLLSEAAEDTLGIAGLLFQYEIERKLDGIIYGLFGITIPPNATESQLEELLRRITNDPITSRLARLETGLAAAEGQLRRIEEGIAAAEEQAREIERIVRENQSELETLEKKICCFVLSMQDYTQQMGAALYGDRGAFRFLVPDVCSSVTVSECVAGVYAPMAGDPTFDAIKPEIRALEADMIVVRQQLEEILRRLGGGLPSYSTRSHRRSMALRWTGRS